jgi:hypothetical protein
MKTSSILSAVALALSIAVCTQTARADTRDATCEVRKDGDKQKGKSGPCTFGQRQGYIDIDLKNGDTVALRPANQSNHFKDQHGHKVVRTQSGGNSQSFKWENGKHVNVTFLAASYHQGGHNKHQGYNQGNYSNQQTYGQDGVGSEHPWATEGGTHHSKGGSPPEVMMGTNGEGEVIFKNNCVVYFDKRGRRTNSLPACSSEQVSRAADAMASYRREQGMN